jgi:hypothetical protein
MMVCRDGELHKGEVGVGAKNFSPSRRLGCDDTRQMDCFATLTMTLFVSSMLRGSLRCLLTSVFALFSFGTKRIFAMTDALVFADTMTTNHRYCEERSDEAIHKKTNLLDCFAALAMTDAVVFADKNATPLAPHFQFSIFNFQLELELNSNYNEYTC